MKLKRILSALLTAAMLVGMIVTTGVVTTATEFPFTDVKETGATAWCYEKVKYVYENNLMSGTAADKFSPNMTMSRAQFVTVLGRLSGVDDNERLEADFVPDTFNDTNKNTWYSSHTAWAQKNNIIAGNGNGGFSPDKAINRQEAAVIIIQYINNYLDIYMTVSADAPAKFIDEAKIDSWAKGFVNTMRRYGIVSGNQNSEYMPKKELDRASGATIFMLFDQKIKELTYEDPYTPDYSVEGEDYLVMGAWDIYYAALGTNTIDHTVGEGDGYSYFTYNSKTSGAAQNWMNLTERGVHIEDYPFVRVGYVSNGGSFTLKLADNSATFYTPSVTNGSEDGIDYVISNVSEASGYEAGTIKRFMCFESTGNVDIVYAAFFKTEADASVFDFMEIADDYKAYDGVAVDYVADADKSVADAYLSDADKRIDEIVNSESVLTPAQVEKLGGTCYYVSSINGDDSNDGKSPETAWKTPLALWNVRTVGYNVLYTSKINPGDGVFFERGSVFDASNELYHNEGSDTVLVGVEGAYYGAYGEGAKPVFSNAVDYYGQTHWTEVEENIWRLDYDFELSVKAQKKAIESGRRSQHDVGNIVLTDKEGNEGWGIKIYIQCDEDSNLEGRLGKGTSTVKLGYVTNGFGDVYHIQSRSAENISAVLKNNLEFFHEFKDDENTSSLYMYYDGDLNEDFSSIVVAKNGHTFTSNNAKMVDNLSFEYTGSHGITSGEVVDMVVQNCTFGWIGGSLQGSGDTRYGNAFENWEDCDGVFIRNNYIYQVYDAGVTTQGHTGIMKDFHITDNVISHALMPIELFNRSYGDEGYSANFNMTGNYILYTGYGFGTTRHDRETRSPFYSSVYCYNGWKNVNFTDNICVYSALHGAFAGEKISLGNTNDGTYLARNVYVTNKITCNMARIWSETVLGFALGSYDTVNTNVPKSDRGVGYFKNLGIELGSKFYNVDEYIMDGEEEGAYVSIDVIG